MQQAVYEALAMQAIDHANCADPEKAGPAKQEITKEEGNNNEWDLKLCPDHVSGPDQIRAPFLHAGGFPLIKPAQMRPPESAMPRARDVVNGIGIRVVIPVVSHPGVRRSGTVEYGAEYQELLDDRVQLDRAMRERAVIPDSRTKTA